MLGSQGLCSVIIVPLKPWFLNFIAISDGFLKLGCGVKLRSNLEREITQ